MSDILTPLSPEDRDALAGELSLGVLTGDDRAQALRLQLADPGFAKAVAAWDARLSPLHARWKEHAPGDAVWRAIDARLVVSGAADTVVDGSMAIRLNRWRAGALMSGALAASLAMILLFQPIPTPAPQAAQIAPQLAVAQMTSTDANMMVVARYDVTNAKLQLRAQGMPQGDLAPELWVIPADGKPRSLGMIAATGSSRVEVTPALRALLSEGTTLAVTMERRDTAPHPAPTSAPVAVGKITII